jgi:hypothetical protein
MTFDPKNLGRAVPVPVHHFPAVEFDMTAGRGVDPGMARAVPVPVHHFPAVEFDMTAGVPSLALTLRRRPDADPAFVEADVRAVWDAVNAFDRSLGGMGLAPVNVVEGGDVIRLTFTPADPAGAADRLAKLAAAVNEGHPAVPREVLTGRSFLACTAELPPAA